MTRDTAALLLAFAVSSCTDGRGAGPAPVATSGATSVATSAPTTPVADEIACKPAGTLCKQAFGAAPGAAASEELGFTRDGVGTDDGYREEPSVIVTGPVEGTTRILLHEMVHVEMKAYVPYDAMPTWFNEGTATMIASEPRCSPEMLEQVRHPTAFDVRTLVSTTDWQQHLQRTNATIETYCGARVAVETWAKAFDGPQGVAAALKSVMGRVAAGGGFDLGG